MFGDEAGLDVKSPNSPAKLSDYTPRPDTASSALGRSESPAYLPNGNLAVTAQADSPSRSVYCTSPVKAASQRVLFAPRVAPRVIPKTPAKILDAPNLQDDFYLNLLDWSAHNIVAVGLDYSVYLWNAENSNVSMLCTVGSVGPTRVSSVCWNPTGNSLAVASEKGVVSLYDPTKPSQAICSYNISPKEWRIGTSFLCFFGSFLRISSQICVFFGDFVSICTILLHFCVNLRHFFLLISHSSSSGCLAWNGPNLLTSGGRDRAIVYTDIRSKTEVRLADCHSQEVCGLKWSPDGRQLASGGNDNQVNIWDLRASKHLHKFRDHHAAVKALAWSPHQGALLASGGGASDKCIRFWDTNKGEALSSIDTGSQVCNLAWSQTANELVSTHGYSLNQVIVWQYPSMLPLATLTGHSRRVLYLATAPDGESIITGAGTNDETLRIWRVFAKSPSRSAVKSDYAMQIR